MPHPVSSTFLRLMVLGVAAAALAVLPPGEVHADEPIEAEVAGPERTRLMLNITNALAKRTSLTDRLRVIAGERAALAATWRELEGRKAEERARTDQMRADLQALEQEIRDLIAKRREAIAARDAVYAEIEDYNAWCGETVSEEEYDRRAPWCEENESYFNEKAEAAERREAHVVSVYEFQRGRYQGLAVEIDAEPRRIAGIQQLQDGLLAQDNAFQSEVDGIDRRLQVLGSRIQEMAEELNRPRPPCTDELDYATRRACIKQMAERYNLPPETFLTKAEMILDAMEYGAGDWPLTLRYFNETMRDRLWWDSDAQAALSYVEGLYGAELLRADAEGRSIERTTLAQQREALLDSFARHNPPDEDPALQGADPLAWRTRRNQLMFDALEAGGGDWWASVRWLEARFEKEQDRDLLVAKSYLEGLFGGS